MFNVVVPWNEYCMADSEPLTKTIGEKNLQDVFIVKWFTKDRYKRHVKAKATLWPVGPTLLQYSFQGVPTKIKLVIQDYTTSPISLGIWTLLQFNILVSTAGKILTIGGLIKKAAFLKQLALIVNKWEIVLMDERIVKNAKRLKRPQQMKHLPNGKYGYDPKDFCCPVYLYTVEKNLPANHARSCSS